MKFFEDRQFPHYVYECIKFSPGLIGLWLEGRNKSGRNILYMELCPPVLLVIKEKVLEQKSYFSDYWKECFSCSQQPFCLCCLDKYEIVGAIIHTSNNGGFLNPFLVLHPTVMNKMNILLSTHS